MPKTARRIPLATSPELTQDQALLRVAFLVAHADGKQSSAETAAIASMLGERFIHLNGPQVESLAMDAVRDVSQYPMEEVLPRVRAALPSHHARLLALHLACEVANADKLLAWQETQHLVKLVDALGLKPDEVTEVVRSYW